MPVTVTSKNLEQKAKEARKNTYIAYEIGEYYYALADYSKAVEWYKIAATGSPVVPMALYAMGYALQTGEGAPVDLIQAFEYYKKAAQMDIPQACYNVAYFYQNGIAVSRDLNQARRYSERASEILKQLVEAAQETKEQLQRMNLDYSQLTASVLEKESEWHAVFNESVQKSKKIGELEALTAEHSRTISELKSLIDAKEKKLQQQEEQYKELVSLHGKALGTIDDLNDDKRSLSLQIDELNAKCNSEVSKNEFLSGKNAQLEDERNKLLQSQEIYQNELMAAQKQIDGLNSELSTLTASADCLKKELEATAEKGAKIKKERNVMFIVAAALAILALASILL